MDQHAHRYAFGGGGDASRTTIRKHDEQKKKIKIGKRKQNKTFKKMENPMRMSP